MVSITEGIKQYARQEGHRTCIIGQSWKKSSRRANNFRHLSAINVPRHQSKLIRIRELREVSETQPMQYA
jgi:hypothetical protein